MTDISNTCSTNTFFVSEQWFTWWPVLQDSCTVTQGKWRFGQVPFVCNAGNFNDLLIVLALSSVCKFAWKWRYITMCSCLKLVLWKTSWHSMLHARYVNVNVNIIRSKACVLKAAVRKMFRRNIAYFLIKNFMVSCRGIGWIWCYGLGRRGLFKPLHVNLFR